MLTKVSFPPAFTSLRRGSLRSAPRPAGSKPICRLADNPVASWENDTGRKMGFDLCGLESNSEDFPNSGLARVVDGLSPRLAGFPTTVRWPAKVAVSDSLTSGAEFATFSPLLLRKKTMKNILQNLLVLLALCLCALVAFQWHREAKLRQEIQKLNDTVHDKLESIQSLEGTLKRSEEEVRRLDGLKLELNEIVKSNRTQIAQLAKDLAKSDAEVEKGLRKIEDYKAAFEQANEGIKKQNEDIRKQNEEVKKLAEERNETVLKYNKVVTEFNDLAKKWNELQQQLSATNAPAKK
jgi:hypothetical protein